jgi:hypothetical protein
MENEKREKSQPKADIGGDANNGNRQIYTRNFGRLLESCVESQQLFIEDAERLVTGLASHLEAFPGDTDQEFVEWASTILTPAIQRLRLFYDLNKQYSKIVYSSIWRALGNTLEPSKFDDYPETVRELSNEIWLYIFQNLDKFTNRGSAKLSTRLFAFAGRHTRDWCKAQQIRFACINRRLAAGKGWVAETLSDVEIAEMRAIERQTLA